MVWAAFIVTQRNLGGWDPPPRSPTPSFCAVLWSLGAARPEPPIQEGKGIAVCSLLTEHVWHPHTCSHSDPWPSDLHREPGSSPTPRVRQTGNVKACDWSWRRGYQTYPGSSKYLLTKLHHNRKMIIINPAPVTDQSLNLRVDVDRVGVYFGKKKSTCYLVYHFPNQRIPTQRSHWAGRHWCHCLPKVSFPQSGTTPFFTNPSPAFCWG